MNNTGVLIDRTEHTSNPITVGRPKHFVFTLNNYNDDELSLLFCNFKIINNTITCTQPTIFDSGLVSYLVVGKRLVNQARLIYKDILNLPPNAHMLVLIN